MRKAGTCGSGLNQGIAELAEPAEAAMIAATALRPIPVTSESWRIEAPERRATRIISLGSSELLLLRR